MTQAISSSTAQFIVINNTMQIRAGGLTTVTIPSAFHPKKLSFGWLNLDQLKKMAISNYSGTVTTIRPTSSYVSNQASLNLKTEKLYRVMVANKFHDFDSREYHMTLIEEKERGT